MKVYVFGNEDLASDNHAFKAAKELKDKIQNVDFIIIKPNEDLPFDNGKDVVILDVVEGIKKVSEITSEDLDKLILSKSVSAHDYDLGFQLKYLKKLGKIGKVTIIGIPMQKEIDYLRIQSILRKLVAQDMQGS
jgi:Ni,Fe-hydrogenase maturation factor